MFGSNWRKAKARLAKHELNISRQRKEFHHQTAATIVKQYDKVVVEDLKPAGMAQGGLLGKQINDAGWTGFINILEQKAKKVGGEVVRVDPAYTSQLCSGCGSFVMKKLRDRVHKCKCGLTKDRDLNASKNILERGLGLAQPCGSYEPKKAASSNRRSRGPGREEVRPQPRAVVKNIAKKPSSKVGRSQTVSQSAF